MNTSSPFFIALGLCIGAAGVTAAVPLDGLVSRSPFMPQPAAGAAPVVTENASVEFRGFITTKDGVLFGLYDRARNVGAWVRENDQGGEFMVRSYDAASDLVTIDYQGQNYTLPFSTARIAAAAPSAVSMASRPAGQSPGGQPAAAQPADATRLESVAAEVRRRRALRQAAASSAPVPAAATPEAPAGGNRQ